MDETIPDDESEHKSFLNVAFVAPQLHSHNAWNARPTQELCMMQDFASESLEMLEPALGATRDRDYVTAED